MFYLVVKTYFGDVSYGVHEKAEIVHITTDFEEAKKQVKNYTIPVIDVNPSDVSYKVIAGRPYFSYECEGPNGMSNICDGYTVCVEVVDFENGADAVIVSDVSYLE